MDNIYNMKKKKEITIESLARMVQKGFLDMREYMDGKFKKVDKRLEKLEKGQAVLEEGQAMLEKGQREIKTELGHKVHVFDHKGLEFRVEKLEEKVKTL